MVGEDFVAASGLKLKLVGKTKVLAEKRSTSGSHSSDADIPKVLAELT